MNGWLDWEKVECRTDNIDGWKGYGGSTDRLSNRHILVCYRYVYIYVTWKNLDIKITFDAMDLMIDKYGQLILRTMSYTSYGIIWASYRIQSYHILVCYAMLCNFTLSYVISASKENTLIRSQVRCMFWFSSGYVCFHHANNFVSLMKYRPEHATRDSCSPK